MWPCRVGCWLVRSEGSSCLLLHSNDVGPSLFTEEIQITDSYAGTDGTDNTPVTAVFHCTAMDCAHCLWGTSYWTRYCYLPGFLVSLIDRNWQETRQKIQVRLYWGPCCNRGEWEQVTVSIACSLRWGWAGSLYGVRLGVGPGVRLEGWLRWFAHPLGGAECRGMRSALLLLLTAHFCSWLFRSGSWVFLVFFLYLIVQNLLQLCMHAAIFSPL